MTSLSFILKNQRNLDTFVKIYLLNGDWHCRAPFDYWTGAQNFLASPAIVLEVSESKIIGDVIGATKVGTSDGRGNFVL